MINQWIKKNIQESKHLIVLTKNNIQENKHLNVLTKQYMENTKKKTYHQLVCENSSEMMYTCTN